MSKVAISISVSLEELMTIEHLADMEGVSRSSMTRNLIRKGIAVVRKEAKDEQNTPDD